MPGRELQLDFYEVLGVTPATPIDEIRRRYKFLVVAFHPDRFQRTPEHHALAEQHIKQVNEAYRVLSDPQARTRYDMMRISAQAGQPAAFYGQTPHLQHELELARARVHQLEQEVGALKTRQETLASEREALQHELEEREQAYRREQGTLEAEAKVLTLQLEQLARERVTFDQLLKDQLARATLKAEQLSQDLVSRERLIESLTTNKAEWEKSNLSRLDLLSQQLQRLKEELRTRDSSLAQQRQAHKALEERMVRVERDAQQTAQHLANALRMKQQELDTWQTGLRATEQAQQRELRTSRLWQVAAVIGVVNTFILVYLLFAH